MPSHRPHCALRLVTVASAAVLCTAGCAVPKKRVSYLTQTSSLPAPVTQQLLARAAHEAVANSAQGMDDHVRGREVCVAVTGTLPMSDEQLLGHVRTMTEGRLAAQGAVVQPCCQVERHLAGGAPATGLWRCDGPRDYRANVGVRAGGIDFTTEQRFFLPKLVGPVLTIVAGIIVASAVALPAKPSDTPRIAMGIGAGGGLALTGAVWALLAPPVAETYQLDARVAVDLDLLPQHVEVVHAHGEGTGEDRLEVRDANDSPYELVP